MAFDINTVTAKASGLFGGLGHSLAYLIPILLVIAIFALFFYKNMFYKYNVRIIRLRANGSWKETNTRGGFVTRAGVAPYFKIVLDRFGFKTKEILKAPSMDAMSPDDRITFIQTDVDTFIQARQDVDISEKLIKFTPIETDTKYGAVLDIQRMNSALEEKTLWKKLEAYVTLAIIFVACIMGWYFLMKAKCPAP